MQKVPSFDEYIKIDTNESAIIETLMKKLLPMLKPLSKVMREWELQSNPRQILKPISQFVVMLYVALMTRSHLVKQLSKHAY